VVAVVAGVYFAGVYLVVVVAVLVAVFVAFTGSTFFVTLAYS